MLLLLLYIPIHHHDDVYADAHRLVFPLAIQRFCVNYVCSNFEWGEKKREIDQKKKKMNWKNRKADKNCRYFINGKKPYCCCCCVFFSFHAFYDGQIYVRKNELLSRCFQFRSQTHSIFFFLYILLRLNWLKIISRKIQLKDFENLRHYGFLFKSNTPILAMWPATKFTIEKCVMHNIQFLSRIIICMIEMNREDT